MKKLLLVILVVCAAGCHTKKELADYSNDRAMDLEYITTTIEIDSCEYITGKAPDGDYGWVFSHKGNCKNCRKFLTELYKK